jgi:hypothetical protein
MTTATGHSQRDIGYLTGLYAARGWLAQFGDRRYGYDKNTVRQLLTGLDAMVLAAATRLNITPDGLETADWQDGDQAAYQAMRSANVSPDKNRGGQ